MQEGFLPRKKGDHWQEQDRVEEKAQTRVELPQLPGGVILW